MYCQKCNRLLRDDSTLCTKCGFDNKMYKSHKLTESKIQNKKVNPLIVVIGVTILIILCFGLTYIFMNKNNNNYNFEEITTQKVTLNNEFKYKNLIVNYPDNWGSSKSTLFNRDIPKINITFHEINETEYNEIKSINDCLKHSFQEFEGLTYAEEKAYGYIFNLNGIYYKIIVNYENNYNYSDSIQNEISQIINSIKEKK